MTPQEVMELVRHQKVRYVDCRYLDFPGLWQHVTYPASELKEDSFVHGFGFDGSETRGWSEINETDMLLVPVAETAHIDPFLEHPTLSVICDIKDPVTKKEFSRDPRSIARKAEKYLASTDIADRAMFAPEMEFFVFDNVWYDQTVNEATYRVDSEEGLWNRGKKDPSNLGNQIRVKEGYFPVAPMDKGTNLRTEMVEVMQKMGIAVEGHHHEVATGGQAEIDLRFCDLLKMADTCMYYKYIVKNVAARYGKVATFMPKPLFMDNGSGMHTHFSMWKGDEPVFSGRHYGGLSQTALYAIGGLLKHAPALCAFTNPTTNSYKRLVPGYEAPVNLVYSSRNRSAAIRIPVYSHKDQTRRLEFRCPDPSCNPYLAFAAMLMAVIDGIQNQIDPGNPLDMQMASLSSEELADIKHTPRSLNQALVALENDHEFLTKGGVFTQDVINHWIKYKRETEINELDIRPHPYEFCMYFDV
ncbi:MAG TPA: type I glutamate--ammonia ligase [Phycisphaerales bacterium]|nr:type I glutamate--ammonia ligase [Phycisphaerales bacterium]|tara:strand:+ start:119 stop:1531 length:1413 start_codon:yes stop_codon:yes gene_type:complete